MRPYNQGNIDFFCGIYAVINACRYAGRNIIFSVSKKVANFINI